MDKMSGIVITPRKHGCVFMLLALDMMLVHIEQHLAQIDSNRHVAPQGSLNVGSRRQLMEEGSRVILTRGR